VEPAGQKKPALQFPLQAAADRPAVAPKVPAGHALCVAEQEPAGQKWPAAHAPSQAGAVRWKVARPKRPAAHSPWHADVAMPAPPHVPHAQRPEQVDAVWPAADP
jgi:hypothetical protein